ncbi:MAG TPA: polysaccharide biosynthesis tyrosine autokinase [Sedimentisphaerales bacterium]|nr:polysaccharide biosynthesis tyrosine autokinase [Sedimentisphaerales bacterium]
MDDLRRYHGQVIEEIPDGLRVPNEPAIESPIALLTAVFRRWYIVLSVFLVMCAIGIPAIWLLNEPLYTVTGALRVAPILPNILTGQADTGEISNYQSFVNTQAEMVISNQVVQRVADDLANKNLAFFEGKTISLAGRLKQTLRNAPRKHEPADLLKQAISGGVIKAGPHQGTELLEITMEGGRPEEARQIVDAFINCYMAVEVSSSAQGEEQKLRVLENERKVLAEKLQRHRETISKLAQEYGTTTLNGRQDMMLQRVTTLLTELTKLEAQRISLETQVQLLEQTSERVIAPEELMRMRNEYINSDPKVQELTRNIVELERQLIVVKQTLAPGNPALKQNQELLEAFQSSLEKQRQTIAKGFDDMVSNEVTKAGKEKLLNTRAELEQTKAYEKRLAEVLAKEDNQTIEIGRKQLQIQDLQFQLDLDKEMYDTVRRRIQELEMERKRPARISVAYNGDLASVRDRRIQYTMALMFAAMACGALLALWRDKADLSLRTPHDVAKHIGVRILGTTTSLHTVKRRFLPEQVVEDYQTIRANLGLFGRNGIPSKLVVTSPGPREGKTTFAVNLATSLARSGKKVLLIDGDLRKPEVRSLLGLPKGSRGLQNVLFGKELQHAVCSIPSTSLDVLPADSRNRADAYELLTLPLTTQRISTLSEKYDHVIIDTPPLLAFPDALVWAKIAGAVVLTSFAGQTTAPDLKEAKEKLGQINVTVLGIVLSNVPVGHGCYRYAYNYYTRNTRPGKNAKRVNAKLLLPMIDGKNSAGSSGPETQK